MHIEWEAKKQEIANCGRQDIDAVTRGRNWMTVFDAVKQRKSVRAFRPDSVSSETVRCLLTDAARAPSGGNLQPWHVHALTGAYLHDFLSFVAGSEPDALPGYKIYPDNLWEPYRSRRYANGEELYASLSIPRDDKIARARQLDRNLQFFGAPVGLFILIDRNMGPPQWADLGCYLQTLMLLAVERGLSTCAQEFWALHSRKVEEFLRVPDCQMLFCGMALGYQDETAPVNQLVTSRAPFQEWGALHGFNDVAS